MWGDSVCTCVVGVCVWCMHGGCVGWMVCVCVEEYVQGVGLLCSVCMYVVYIEIWVVCVVCIWGKGCVSVVCI